MWLPITHSRFASKLMKFPPFLALRKIDVVTLTSIWFLAVVVSNTQAALSPLFIEGYAGRESVAPGEKLTFHVSTSAAVFDLQIVRLGQDRDEVLRQTKLRGAQHAVPDKASSEGCGWPVAHTLTIPESWRSGYYEVTLLANDRGERYSERGARTAEGKCFFVVRPAQPGRDTKILLQLATNTYNAYNNWGGHSLYAYNSRHGNQGSRVSFERPPSSQFSRWELPFVRWAERNGYRIDYATNLDLEQRPEMLAEYRLVLSVGHDEYWSTPMRDALEAFIGRGGNVAFFSGNTCCWQVRTEDGGKALTSWKQNYLNDPAYIEGNNPLISTLWSHHLLKRPENTLTGVGFLWGGFHRSHGMIMDGTGGYKVHRPDHWIFAGTQLKAGDEFGTRDTIVGYECDGAELEWRGGLPYPTGRDGTPKNFAILATAPAKWHPGDAAWYGRDSGWTTERMGAGCLGLYTRGGTVFTAGTTDWSHGLTGNDPVVERITRNILDRLSQ